MTSFIKKFSLEKRKKAIDEVNSFIEEFRVARKDLDYETDGVVISLNKSKERDILGI